MLIMGAYLLLLGILFIIGGHRRDLKEFQGNVNNGPTLDQLWTNYIFRTNYGPTGMTEPAEPEPPPAHSLGRVGEDDMGRSGQLVRPCWLGAGGEALVVRNWWRGWWLGLPRLLFFDQVCDQLCTVLSTFLVDFASKTVQKSNKKLKSTFFKKKVAKWIEKCENTFCLGGHFGTQNRPK